MDERRRALRRSLSWACLLLALALAVGCSGSRSRRSREPLTPITEASYAATTTAAATTSRPPSYALALITDGGDVDDGAANAQLWSALEALAAARERHAQFYVPVEVSTPAFLAAIDLAIAGGAELVVARGFAIGPAFAEAQHSYPDIHFALLDGYPYHADGTLDIAANTMAVQFDELQLGFLAGYAAVADGYRQLAFLAAYEGGPSRRYGYGVVQGAEAAAQALELAPGAVRLRYHYVSREETGEAVDARIAALYDGDTELILPFGGQLEQLVLSHARRTGRRLIATELSAAEAMHVVCSARMQLDVGLRRAVDGLYGGGFRGGELTPLGAAEGAVAIELDGAQFVRFDQAQYEAILGPLADGSLALLGEDEVESATQLPKTLIDLQFEP